MILANVPVLVWGALMIDWVPSTGLPAIFAPLAFTMIGSNITLNSIAAYYVDRTSQMHRIVCVALLIALAAGAAITLLLVAGRTQLWVLGYVLVIISVLLQRPIVFFLSTRQQQIRFGFMLTGYMMLYHLLDENGTNHGVVVFCGGGLVFCASSIATLAMTLWNEYRGNTSWAHLE
jgi:hypothetical protein